MTSQCGPQRPNLKETKMSRHYEVACRVGRVKLDLLTDIDMLLMVEKGVRGVICHSIFRYAKLITNT